MTVAPSTPRRHLILALPLLLFSGLALLFLLRLSEGGPPSTLPSALIGRPIPNFVMDPLPGLASAGFATADLQQGRVSLVNVWASWCVPCRDEHPLLMALANAQEFDLLGINNKDNPETARRFLGQFGNPFKRIGVDNKGRVSIDFGVYGVPETFVVDGKGIIRLRHVGPLTPDIVERIILPAIAAARLS